MFALADCNNFYASCQRVFRPDLEGKPIVVLSNNDGCIIARSNEAKALGIPMAAPEYKWQGYMKYHHVHVFSSNYPLYADMSTRVMRILERFEPNIEIYSIDEAFLDIQGIPKEELRDHALEIRQTVLQWTGLPLSIGIAPTKTLSKLANHICKKVPELKGVLVLHSFDDALPWLQKTRIGNVWGVGRRWAKKLEQNGIRSAADLALANHGWIRKRYSIVLQRTALELTGKSCIAMEETPNRQQILVSRSFRPKITDYDKLHRFMAGYVSRAAEKLRSQNSLAKNITLFIRTGSHNDNTYSNHTSINLSQYTADTATLIRATSWGLKKIYKPGFQYYKAGIMLNDLIPEKNQQLSLFSHAVYDDAARKRMRLLDNINQRFGPETLRIAREPEKHWQMPQLHLSPAYTTRWDELLKVY